MLLVPGLLVYAVPIGTTFCATCGMLQLHARTVRRVALQETLELCKCKDDAASSKVSCSASCGSRCFRAVGRTVHNVILCTAHRDPEPFSFPRKLSGTSFAS